MARGKYSPTISMAYSISQKWWDKFSDNGYYDKEGYDSYGYDKNDVDRAGIHEDDYLAAPLEEYDNIDGRTTFEGLCSQAQPFEVALVERLRKLEIL